MKLTLEEAKEMMDQNNGNLDLRGTNITALPDNLTVGGWLNLSNTNITALPDNLTVGGWLYLRDTEITNPTVKRLRHGEYVSGKYLYADRILTHVKKKKKIGEYTLFVGKIPGYNVVFDGKYYAHCRNFRDGVADPVSYTHLTLPTILRV